MPLYLNDQGQWVDDDYGPAPGAAPAKQWTGSQGDWDAYNNPSSARSPVQTEDFLKSFAYTQGGAQGTGELKRFLDGLVAKGFTGDDFVNGLEKYNQMQGLGYARPNDADYPADSSYKYNGNEHVGWWGEQERIKAIGAGLEALGKPTGWQSQYNPELAQQQQDRVGQIGTESQNSDRNDSDLGDVLTFAGFAGALFGLSGLMAGAGAGAGVADVGATAAAAGDAGFLTAGGVSTPATGGMFVGNSGLLGGTGNAIADAALNGAVRGGVTSALTGGDIGNGLISGGLSGGISSALPDLGGPILNNAARGAVSGGVGAAVNGGDILTGAAAGGAAGAVGTAVRGAVPTDIGGNTLTNALAGGAAGAVGTAIAGGDVTTGLIRGAVTGGASGLATDLGADPTVAGAVGTAAGGLINAPTPTNNAGAPSAPSVQQQTSNEITSGLGFSVVLPQFRDSGRRDMQWGTRLQGAQ